MKRSDTAAAAIMSSTLDPGVDGSRMNPSEPLGCLFFCSA
jgi:hypothetical protein